MKTLTHWQRQHLFRLSSTPRFTRVLGMVLRVLPAMNGLARNWCSSMFQGLEACCSLDISRRFLGTLQGLNSAGNLLPKAARRSKLVDPAGRTLTGRALLSPGVRTRMYWPLCLVLEVYIGQGISVLGWMVQLPV